MNLMSLNTTQDKAPVYNVDKNYAIRKEKIFFIRLLLLVVIIRVIIMSKYTCILNTIYMYMLQLSLFTACSHPLKKKYRKKYATQMKCVAKEEF